MAATLFGAAVPASSRIAMMLLFFYSASAGISATSPAALCSRLASSLVLAAVGYPGLCLIGGSLMMISIAFLFIT